MIGVVLVAGCGSVGSRAEELALTEHVFPQLAPILSDALGQSPRMIQQNLERLRAELEALAAEGRLKPRVDASLQYNLQYEQRAEDDDYRSNRKLYYSVGASYPLFSWGSLQAEVEISAIAAKIAEQNFREAYRQLADQIRQAYLRLIIEAKAVRNAEFADGIAQRRLTVLKGRVERGEVGSAALGGAGIDVEESALAVDISRRNLDQSLRAFRRLTGSTTFGLESIPETIPPITGMRPEDTSPFNTVYVEQHGYRDDLRYAKAELELERERRHLHVARVAQRPRLELLAGYTEDELAFVSNIGQRSGVRSLYGAIRVNWNIFDGFASRRRLQSTRARVKMFENQLANLEEDLTEGAKQAATNLDLARRGMFVADSRYHGDIGGHNHLRQELEAQRATPEQLANSQVGLNNSEMRALAARAAYLNALSAYAAAINADPAGTAAESAARATP